MYINSFDMCKKSEMSKVFNDVAQNILRLSQINTNARLRVLYDVIIMLNDVYSSSNVEYIINLVIHKSIILSMMIR